jgi:MFS family permease
MAVEHAPDGRRGLWRVMTGGLAALVPWSLLFFPLADTKSLPLITLAVCGMMVLQGPYMGSQPAAFSELFPAVVRYSGASLSVSLGTIVGGATAPLVATTLFERSGNSSLISLYLGALSVVSWVCATLLKRTHRRSAADKD